jgi:hypothetical protein
MLVISEALRDNLSTCSLLIFGMACFFHPVKLFNDGETSTLIRLAELSIPETKIIVRLSTKNVS